MFTKNFTRLASRFLRKATAILGGSLFLFSSLVVPVSAQVFYPGDPGTGMTPGAYGSYEYSFCYYNNNDDLECFDSARRIGVTKNIVSINGNPSKTNVNTSEGGATVRYRVSFTNNLNPAAPLTTVYLRDYLPDVVASITAPQIITNGTTASNPGSFTTSNNNQDLTWTGTLNPGQTLVFEFDATLRATLTNDDVGPHVNTICAATTPIQNGSATDCANATFDVIRNPVPPNTTDLSLEKNINGINSFRPGDTITYSFRVTNNGSTPVTSFVINDNNAIDPRTVWPTALLNNFSTTGATASLGSVTVNSTNNTISWSGATLNPNQSVTITVNATVRQNLPLNSGNYDATNRACVQIQNDSTPANDCSTVIAQITIPPTENPALGIEKQIRNNLFRSINPSQEGQRIPYQVTITNTSNQNVNEFFIIDVLPPALVANSLQIDSVTTGNATIINTTDIRWTAPSGQPLQPLQTVTINFSVALTDRNNLQNLVNSLQRNIACVRLTADGRNEGCHYDWFNIVPENRPTPVDLQLFKGERFGRTGFRPGDTVTYEFIVTNISNTPVNSFFIEEVLWPDQLDGIQSVQADRGTVTLVPVSFNGGDVRTDIFWENSTLGPGESVVIYVTTSVRNNLNITQTTPATNRACVEHPDDPSNGPRGNNNCREFQINILPEDQEPPENPVANIQKIISNPDDQAFGHNDPNNSNRVRYSITVANTGTTNLTQFQIRENLPNLLTGITDVTVVSGGGSVTVTNGNSSTPVINWTGTLAPGQEVVINYRGVLVQNLNIQPGQSVNQTNTARLFLGDNQVGEDSTTFTVYNRDNPPTNPDIILQKFVSLSPNISNVNQLTSNIVVRRGDNITYYFLVSNAAGPNITTFQINENQFPTNAVENVRNARVITGGGSVSLSGNNLTWNGTLTTGNFVLLAFDATVRSNAPVGQATNVANVPNLPNETNTTNNTDRATIVVDDRPVPNDGLGIQKAVVNRNSSPNNPGGAPQQLVRRGIDTTVRYVISISNNTNTSVTNFTIVEQQWPNVFQSITNIETTRGTATLAANQRDIVWNGTGTNALAPGEQVDIYFTGTLRQNLTQADEGTHVNVASVTFNGITRSDDADFTITPPNLNPNPDLGLQKEADRIIINPGGTITYRFTVTNYSAQEFNGEFLIQEQWPGQFLNNPGNLLWSFGTATLEGTNIRWQGRISPGAALVIIFTTTARDVEGLATNFAVLRDRNGNPWQDSNPNNDRDQTTVTIRRGPTGDPIDNVQKVMNGNTLSVAPNAPVTFTASFTNNSTQNIFSVRITETPTNFSINSITANIGTITGTAPNYTWNAGSTPLRPGETLTITITGTVTGRPGEFVRNLIRFDEPRDNNNNPINDPNPNNNQAQTPPVPIEGDPIDNVTKNVNGNLTSVGRGQDITFTVTVTNRSGRTVTRYTITELATNFTINTITASTGTVSGSYPNYTWTGSLANNQTLTLTITGRVTGPGGQNVVNRITFSEARDEQNRPIEDPDQSDNTAQTRPIPIRQDGPTPITGGGVAIVAGILSSAALATIGIFLYKRSKGGFKLSS